MTEADDREAERAPNPIDVHVGAKVRMRRKAMGVSQERLASDLGLTFQQVQKYERGANRVSASKLYDIARALQVGIQFFFDGLPDPAESLVGVAESETPFSYDMVAMSPDVVELAQIVQELPKRRRRLVRDLARELAGLPPSPDAEADRPPPSD